MKITDQQAKVIECNDDNIVVKAGAGAAKTTTLNLYTKARQKEKFLYLAFNRSIKEEAEKKFGSNVVVMTTHSAAYRAIGNQYKDNLVSSIKPYQVIKALKLENRARVSNSLIHRYAKRISETINNFMISADDHLDSHHAVINMADSTERAFFGKEDIAKFAAEYWDMMVKGKSHSPMTHDGYLKMFMLKGFSLGNFDRILLDEAQDSNPVTVKILNNQDAGKILVGDNNQSIYSFRGAIDAMDILENATQLKLNQSFRFGNDIARTANIPLVIKNATEYVVGTDSHGDVLFSPEKSSWAEVYNNLKLKSKPLLLSRTTFGLLGEAVKLSKKNIPMNFIGGIEGYRFTQMDDIIALKFGGKVHDEFIATFDSYDDFKAYAETDIEMRACDKIIEEYGKELPGILEDIKKLNSPQDESRIMLSTTHKAKGLEADVVALTNDFYKFSSDFVFDQETKQIKKEIDIEEMNLAYVAMTRAKKTLILPHEMSELLLNESLSRTASAMMVSAHSASHVGVKDIRDKRRMRI